MGEGLGSQKFFKESIKPNWNFERGGVGGGQTTNNLLWERYEYFLKQHIAK